MTFKAIFIIKSEQIISLQSSLINSSNQMAVVIVGDDRGFCESKTVTLWT